ncbi:MAG: hypothetical protein R3F62_11080 [Planctomycetota bacterium]
MVQAEDQHALTVHETVVDGGLLREEPWLTKGEGSAFVSRPNDVVCVRVSDDGFSSLPLKAQQLVDHGFHAVAIELGATLSVPLDEPAENRVFGPLLEAIKHVQQFVGWVGVCTTSDDARRALANLATAAGERDAFAIYPDRAAAIAAYRSELTSDEPPPPPNSDWGWVLEDAAGSVEVDVAELLLEPDELEKFPEQARELTSKGRTYLTVRVHRPRGWEPSGEHVTALIQGRDVVEAAGGQLALVTPEEDLQAWLRLLGEGQRFLVVDSADEAEDQHMAHAARKVAPETPRDVPSRAFQVVSKSERSIQLRARDGGELGSTELPAQVVRLGREGVPALAGRLLELANQDVQDVFVALTRFTDIEGERLEPLRKAAKRAEQAGMRVVFYDASPEVKALLEILGVDVARLHPDFGTATQALAAWVHRVAPFHELVFTLTHEDLTDSRAGATLPDSASDVGLLEPAPDEGLELRAELARARAKLGTQSAERDAAVSRAAAAERERDELRTKVRQLTTSSQADERRILDLEQARRRAERALEDARERSASRAEIDALQAELEQLKHQHALELGELQEQLSESQAASRELATTRAELADLRARAEEASAEDPAALLGRLKELEQELREVSRERELLREELESAGEMIERLGKELERS